MKALGMSRKVLVTAVAIAGVGVAAAADQSGGGKEGEATAAVQPSGVTEGKSAQVPLGDLAGAQQSKIAPQLNNPQAGEQSAIETGKQLFSTMNCAACHGYDAKGAMGPDLTDTYWKYGGTPVMVYKSIFEGRPQGMPAWEAMLPPEAIWNIVAYIQSLGGTFPADKFDAAQTGDLSKGITRSAAKSTQDAKGRR
jgi:cytochrome c oxidase cbb3-type subunit 3